MNQTTVPDFVPRMTKKEIATLKRQLETAQRYVEWGSGGSTLLAVRSPTKKIWTVESDPAWIAQLRTHPEIKTAEDSGRLKFLVIDIGPTGRWGKPVDDANKEKWPAYVEAIWADKEARRADFFFVDGRFRVSCALSVARRGDRNATVAMHDFWKRGHYHNVLLHLKWQSTSETLVVLKKKFWTNPIDLLAAERRWRYDFR